MKRLILSFIALVIIMFICFVTIYEGQCNIKEYKDVYTSEFTPNENLGDYYRSIERFPIADYSGYVFSPYDDSYLLKLASTLNNSIYEIVHYVRELPYISDVEEYPKFPMETILDNGGDCEDKSILGASLLFLSGFNVSLIRCPNHMVVGVQIASWDDFGVIGGYVYLDMTNDGGLGEIPDSYKGESFEIYPIIRRPLLYHDWDTISISSCNHKLYFELEITIYNIGITNVSDLVIDTNFCNDIKIPFIRYQSSVTLDIKVRGTTKSEVYRTDLIYDGISIHQVRSESNKVSTLSCNPQT